MKQSDERMPGRGRPPASFGRGGEEPAEDFTIRGGQAFHLVLHLDVHPDAASLEALHTAVRDTTRSAVLDGYAEAFAAMDDPDETADVVVTPPAPPVPEGDGG